MNLSNSIATRLAYRSRIGDDPYKQALEKAVCAIDPVHWINHWAWTYDPREAVSTLPFNLFPKQAEFIRWVSEREQQQENGLVEKSRDMGITWLCAAYALHAWLFRDGAKIGFGSRKLDLVDKIGDPDCIFEKIRYMLRNLPVWMLPAGFKFTEHDNFAKLINPANGSTITGEGGDNIGRGGRASLYFVDEAAFLERPQKVDAALSQTTRCRIDVSTPNGPGNPFAKKRHSGRVPVFTFHWRDDPRKDDAWYARQKDLLDPVVVAQEIDIDYAASIEGICIPAAWVRAAVNLELPESGSLVGGLDIAEEGSDKTILVPRRGPVVKVPKRIPNGNTTQTAWNARDEARSLGVKTLYYDADGPGMGVRGTWETSEEPLGFEVVPVHWGSSPTNDLWADGKTSAEKFINLRAELWYKLRARFEKSYEYRELGIQHPADEMISIPDVPELISDLSLPLVFRTETGKIKLESKEAMRQRGVKSPDYGDALAYSFTPEPPKKWAQDKSTLEFLKNR